MLIWGMTIEEFKKIGGTPEKYVEILDSHLIGIKSAQDTLLKMKPWDTYKAGLYNGIEIALALLQGKEPELIDWEEDL